MVGGGSHRTRVSGTLPKIVAYGLASFVSYSRIKARQHFPSDVFIGGMMGQMIAQDVYSRRHDPELGGGEWASLSALARAWESSGPQNLGSPYVPLDSWIYPALDRLAGLGLIDSAFSGMRPWTRRECMRQLNEAEEKGVDAGENTEAGKLVEALEREFRPESEALGDGSDGAGFRLESVLLAHGAHFRRAADGRLYVRADTVQRFWASVRRRMEHGERFFGLRDERSLGRVCARRDGNRARAFRRIRWRRDKSYRKSTYFRSWRRGRPKPSVRRLPLAWMLMSG